MSKGTHSNNFSMIEKLCGGREFTPAPEGKIFGAIAKGEAWPTQVHKVSYDQNAKAKDNEEWYHKVIYTMSQREAQFIVLPYAHGYGDDRKNLFVAFQYDIAKSIANTDVMLSIKPTEIARKGEVTSHYSVSDGMMLPCCWYFGFNPTWYSVKQKTTGMDLDKMIDNMNENDKKNMDDKTKTKAEYTDECFKALFLVYKPVTMKLYQKRFGEMLNASKKEYARISMAQQSLMLHMAGDDAKAAAKEQLTKYVTACYTIYSNKKIEGTLKDDKDRYDLEFLKQGAAKSICNIYEFLKPEDAETGPEEVGEDMIKIITKQVQETDAAVSLVTSFKWIDPHVVAGLKDEIFPKLAENVTDVLDSIPFSGALLKIVAKQGAKLLGHYLRPMLAEKEWKALENNYGKVMYAPIGNIDKDNYREVLKQVNADNVLTYVDLTITLTADTIRREVENSYLPTRTEVGASQTFVVTFYCEERSNIMHPVFIHRHTIEIFCNNDDAFEKKTYADLHDTLKNLKLDTIDMGKILENDGYQPELGGQRSSLYAGATRYGQFFFAIYPNNLKGDLLFVGKSFSGLLETARTKLKQGGFFNNGKYVTKGKEGEFKGKLVSSEKGKYYNDRGEAQLFKIPTEQSDASRAFDREELQFSSNDEGAPNQLHPSAKTQSKTQSIDISGYERGETSRSDIPHYAPDDRSATTKERIEALEGSMVDMVTVLSNIEESMEEHVIRTRERKRNFLQAKIELRRRAQDNNSGVPRVAPRGAPEERPSRDPKTGEELRWS